jgi:TolB-like protein
MCKKALLLSFALLTGSAAHASPAPQKAAAVAKPKPAAAKPKKPTKAEEEAAAAEAAAAAAAAAEAEAKAAELAAADKAAADKAAAEQAAAEQAAAAAAAARKKAAAEARGLDARIRVLAESLALSLKRLPGDHREQRFAVLPFESVGEEAQQKSLGLVVSDLIVTDLARDHRLPLVERSQIATVMGELALQQSGAIDEAQVLQVGKAAGARALIVGTVADAGDTFIVTARAVDAEAGTIMAAEETKLPKEELVAFSADAVVLKSKSAALFRSMVLPGWGQFYNGDAGKGAVFGGITLGLAATTVAVTGLGAINGVVLYPAAGTGNDEISKLPAAEKSAAVANLRETANAQLNAGAVLAGITLVAWGITAADAYISGVDVESLDAALARR